MKQRGKNQVTSKPPPAPRTNNTRQQQQQQQAFSPKEATQPNKATVKKPPKNNNPSLLRRIFSRARSSRKLATAANTASTPTAAATPLFKHATAASTNKAATRNRPHKRHQQEEDDANNVGVPLPPPCERTASYETAQTYDMTVISSMSEETYNKKVLQALPQRAQSPQTNNSQHRGDTTSRTRAPPGHNALSPSLRMGSFRQLSTEQGGSSNHNSSIKVTSLALLSSSTASSSSRVHRSTGTESLGEFQPHQPNHHNLLLEEDEGEEEDEDPLTSLLMSDSDGNDEEEDGGEFNAVDFDLDIDLDLDQKSKNQHKQSNNEHDGVKPNEEDDYDNQSTGSSCSGLTMEEQSCCFDNGNDDSSTVLARLNTVPSQQPVGRLGEGVTAGSRGVNGKGNMASPKTASTKQPLRVNGMIPPTYISTDDEDDDDDEEEDDLAAVDST